LKTASSIQFDDKGKQKPNNGEIKVKERKDPIATVQLLGHVLRKGYQQKPAWVLGARRV
jgi:hypothetical protein